VIESNAMGQLRVQQAYRVAPGTESARPILHARFPCNLGDFALGNKIANMAQNVKPTTCWIDCFFVFHPCRVAGSKRQANTFFIFCGMAVSSFQISVSAGGRYLTRLPYLRSNRRSRRVQCKSRPATLTTDTKTNPRAAVQDEFRTSL